jgi:RNA polymerase sigma-70 factor (ECF subfamily)
LPLNGIQSLMQKGQAMPQAREPTRIGDLEALQDADLVRMALQRHADAFRIIMQRHNRRLYRCARSIVRDDAEAEDIVQEAYVNAFSKLAAFRGESSLATWLTRITLNEALGRVRRRRPAVAWDSLDTVGRDKAQVIAFPLTANADPERTAAQREIGRFIERAVDGLPERFRMVFVMREIEEMSVEETADFLGLRQATVKTRLHRARRLLRTALDDQLAAALTEAFPFAGMRCARMTDAILGRLGLAPSPTR